MKRIILATSLTLVVVVPAVANAFTKAEVTQYERAYAHAKKAFGIESVGCRLFYSCHGKVTGARLATSTNVLHRMFNSGFASHSVAFVVPPNSAPAPVATVSSGGGGLSSIPGVPSGFASCIAFRESTNGQLSSNVYGLQSYVPGESLAQQKAAVSQMYASRGTEPWAPYDGC